MLLGIPYCFSLQEALKTFVCRQAILNLAKVNNIEMRAILSEKTLKVCHQNVTYGFLSETD